MNNFYYLLWSDAIVGFRKNNPNRSDWKFTILITITTCNALNLWVIFLWLKFFHVFFISTELNLFHVSILNGASWFITYFASPFFLLNYFSIFYHDRYKKLVKEYPNKNGKIAMAYVIISASIGFFSLVLYSALQ